MGERPGREFNDITLVGPAGQSLKFSVVEVSRLGLGVLSESFLEPGMVVKCLYDAAEETDLRVVSSAQVNASSYIYVLASIDMNLNFERVIQLCSKGLNGTEGINPRAGRFETKPFLNLQVKTFGSIGKYLLHTINISKSGMLLGTENNRVPFRANTIIELEICGDDKMLKEDLQCIGKVIRRQEVSTNLFNAKLGFAVQISEFLDGGDVVWASLVDTIESSMLKDFDHLKKSS